MRSNFISHIHIGTTEQANAHEKYNSFFFGRKKKANAHEHLPVLAEVLKALLSGTGLEVVCFFFDKMILSVIFSILNIFNKTSGPCC